MVPRRGIVQWECHPELGRQPGDPRLQEGRPAVPAGRHLHQVWHFGEQQHQVPRPGQQDPRSAYCQHPAPERRGYPRHRLLCQPDRFGEQRRRCGQGHHHVRPRSRGWQPWLQRLGRIAAEGRRQWDAGRGDQQPYPVGYLGVRLIRILIEIAPPRLRVPWIADSVDIWIYASFKMVWF